MSIVNLKNPVKVAKSIRDISTEDICFNLNGQSLIYKSNYNDQARAPKAKGWRKTVEGLKPYSVAKGSKLVVVERLPTLWLL